MGTGNMAVMVRRWGLGYWARCSRWEGGVGAIQKDPCIISVRVFRNTRTAERPKCCGAHKAIRDNVTNALSKQMQTDTLVHPKSGPKSFGSVS